MNIEVVERKFQPTLCVRTFTSVEKLPELIGNSYHRIMTYMEQMGEEMDGEPYVGYFSLDMQHMDVEIGIPVDKILPGMDDISPSELPMGEVVTALYKGAYGEMEKAYNEITAWINANGYKPTGPAYEIYYNSPAEVTESELLTRIEFPVTRVMVENK
jgi:effector-binding domain-containing protein